MGIFGLVLLVLAVALVVGAEWPRLSERFGADARRSHARSRSRSRRKSRLTLIHGHGDRDDFAQSVQRDLANLPTVEEPDRRRH